MKEQIEMKIFPIADIDDVTLAFPGSVSHLMPAQVDIPDEFKHGNTKWNKIQSRWFYEGLLEGTQFIPKEGIDAKKALRHLTAIQRSFEPKHEHKESAVAYLLSQWFKDVIFILVLCITVSAQSPTQEKPARAESTQAPTSGQIVLPKQKRLRFDYGDLVYLAGSVADIASSVGQHESNPALKNAQGNFSLGKGLALKGGVYAAIKTVEYFYPDRPKATMWFKGAIGCAWGAVALHNARVRQ